MTSAAYQYIGDDGTTYQVVLPSDFAAALNYSPATGSEPYLPNWISYRYATYQSASGLFVNSACITTPFSAYNPPTQITVSGVTYVMKSEYGEQRGVPLIPGLFTIAGPQGAAGAAGSPGAAGPPGATGPAGANGLGYSMTPVVVTSAELIALATTPVLIIPAPGAGKTNFLTAAAGRWGSGTAYSPTSGISLQYGNSTGGGAQFGWLYTQAMGGNPPYGMQFYNQSDVAVPAENMGIYLASAGGALTGGTCDLTVFAFYVTE